MSWITCAFCKGAGKDPFNLLSRLAACQVCGGTGKVYVDAPEVVCSFCKGTGVHPHSRISCSACAGRGCKTLKGIKEKCPHCGGKGHKISDDLPCSICGGKGFICKVKVEKNQARKVLQK